MGIEKHVLRDAKVAIVYRGHYYRTGDKTSNAFNCFDNHIENIHQHIHNKDIYFHTYTGVDDTKLINMIKPSQYIIQSRPPEVIKKLNSTSYSSRVNTFIQANKLFDVSMYEYILNLRFDLQVNTPVYSWPVDILKFNTLHPERTWSNWYEEYKTSDLLYLYPSRMHDDYIQSVKELHNLESRVKLRYKGYNRRETKPIGWTHWLTKHMEPKIGLNNIHIMYPEPYYSGGTPEDPSHVQTHNPNVHINRKQQN